MKIKHNDLSLIVMLLSIYLFVTSIYVFDVNAHVEVFSNPIINVFQYISPQVFFGFIMVVIIMMYGNYVGIKYNLYYVIVAVILMLIFNTIVTFSVILNNQALSILIINLKFLLLVILLVLFHSQFNASFILKTFFIVFLISIPKLITMLVLLS